MKSGRAASALGLIVAFTAGPVGAQDGPECFPSSIRHNICETARKMHRELVKSVPMKVSSEMTMTAAILDRTTISLMVDMSRPRSDYDAHVRSTGLTQSEFAAAFTQMSKNAACSDKVLSAFTGLGGKIQYMYRTSDGFVIVKALVENCPWSGK